MTGQIPRGDSIRLDIGMKEDSYSINIIFGQTTQRDSHDRKTMLWIFNNALSRTMAFIRYIVVVTRDSVSGGLERNEIIIALVVTFIVHVVSKSELNRMNPMNPRRRNSAIK